MDREGAKDQGPGPIPGGWTPARTIRRLAPPEWPHNRAVSWEGSVTSLHLLGSFLCLGWRETWQYRQQQEDEKNV